MDNIQQIVVIHVDSKRVPGRYRTRHTPLNEVSHVAKKSALTFDQLLVFDDFQKMRRGHEMKSRRYGRCCVHAIADCWDAETDADYSRAMMWLEFLFDLC